MGATKTEHFSAQQNEIAALMKALGHPARVAIIEYLLKVDKCICGDIVEELPLAQPTVSQHLRELRSVDLIQGNVEGNAICYCVNKETIAKLLSYCQHVIQQTEAKQGDGCCG